jgi:hypothetical protein
LFASEKLNKMSESKFRKIAAPAKPRKTSKPPKPAGGAATSGSSSSSSSPTSNPILDRIDQLKEYFLGSGDNYKFDPQEIKEAFEYLTSLGTGWTKERYKPSAFIHALEMDKNRGYKNTSHSQGAYEVKNPTLQKELEDFKKNAPSNMKDLLTKKPIENLENINLDESSDRYKAMKENLFGNTTANTSSKFVKTSQKQEIDEFKKLIPKWDINDVLQDMAKVASRQDLSPEEKRSGMANVLSKYERDIAPLNQYLRKNDIKYK